jgi:DNA processing protein
MAMLELPGIGPVGVNRLRRLAGSTAALVSAVENGALPGSRLDHDSALDRVRAAWGAVRLGKYQGWVAETLDSGHHIVLADDEEYPTNLRDVSTAPPLLYVWGSLSALRPQSLALVGSVEPTPRGVARARKMARLCTEHGIVVVSGLARGIDGASHEAALESGASTFAVVGHGLRYLYPPEHAQLAGRIAATGALVSQFAPEVGPQRWTFPARNELMCTIAKGTVIVEVERNEKFGSVIQARFSIKHGRPVFILRSNITEVKSEVAQKLVESGDAVEVREFEDVLTTLATSNPVFAGSEDAPDLFTPTVEALQVEAEAATRAILFDLDGVIHDSRELMIRAYAKAMREAAGVKVNTEELATMLTQSPMRIYAKYGVAYEQANRLYNRAYMKLLETTDCVFTPVVTFIHRAKASGFKVGLITRQPRGRTEKVLERCGVAGALDVTVTWNDVPRDKLKPHPMAMEQALAVLGVPPERATYVGDTPDDLEFAKNARVRSVAVGWGLTPPEDLLRFSPDIYLETFPQLDMLLAT